MLQQTPRFLCGRSGNDNASDVDLGDVSVAFLTLEIFVWAVSVVCATVEPFWRWGA
jgi:hypothetical protein